MSYLEELRSRRKTPQIAWHKLRTTLGTKKFCFFVVFEGEEDEEYYSTYIERILPGKPFRPIICDGKGGVLALHSEMIRAYGDTKNVYFFVDTDHDRYISQAEYPAQTFNTCGYSVENYCFDKQALRSVARKCYQLNLDDPIYVDLEGKIDAAFEVFCTVTRPVMSYVVGLRRQDQILDMDQLHFVDLFELEEAGLISKDVDIGKLAEKMGSPNLLSDAEFKDCEKDLISEKVAVFCRGKLVSQFLLNFLKSIPKLFAGIDRLNGKPLKSKIEVGRKNLILIFAEFIDVPARLRTFLEQIASELDKPKSRV